MKNVSTMTVSTVCVAGWAMICGVVACAKNSPGDIIGK